MPRFLIAAAHKSSGKTVISAGLASHLTKSGKSVQCFKKGPDYIDPMWLSTASDRNCYNLDFNTMTDAEILQLLAMKSQDADISLIEANKGLYDGGDLKGRDSNAQLAKLTSTPVVLVIDTTGMTRGIAPLIQGYQGFDADVPIAGVILNKVGGTRHEGKLRAAIEAYTDLPVLGSVWKNPDLSVDERHLGLVTPGETLGLLSYVKTVERIVGSSVDLPALFQIASGARDLELGQKSPVRAEFSGLKIGVPSDRAFGFYYPDDLEEFHNLGARVVFFDALSSLELPEIDGLFIGGGFPETSAEALSANAKLRRDIKEKINQGLPTYAECGGLMYLCRSIQWGGRNSPMCGVFDHDTIMCNKPQGRGYIEFRPTADHPWGLGDQLVKAHEFHYAKLDPSPQHVKFAQELVRGFGIDGHRDGLIKNNALATFSHQRNTISNPWINNFLNFVLRVKSV